MIPITISHSKGLARMTRILVFLSTFIIVVGAAVALYIFSGGDAAKLRGDETPVAEAPVTPADAAALLEEATDYFLGEGVAQSDEKGAALVQRAADAGNHRAIGFLGTLYMGGIGVEQDFDKAKEWLALSNDLEAQELAANLMAFDTIIGKLPPEEKEKQLNAAKTAAHEQVRASFIAALRDLRAQQATPVTIDNTAADDTAVEESAVDAAPDADVDVDANADTGTDADSAQTTDEQTEETPAAAE